MQYAFGAGVLYGRQTLTGSGAATTQPTPVRFGGLQGVTLDFSFNIKELFSSYQFPIAVGRGTGKITGKASFAQLNAQALNDLFFGQSSIATGRKLVAQSEAHTVTSNIVTATNNTTYLKDLGVTLASTGDIYVNVNGNTPVGLQYTVNESTGVYTFNNTQENAAVLINYEYNDASNGRIITIANQLLGSAPQFMAVFTESFQGKKLTLVLNAGMSSKLTLATKLEDFMIPDFDMNFFADAAGNIGNLSLDE